MLLRSSTAVWKSANKKEIMKKVLKSSAKFLIALLLDLAYGWFALSSAFSADEMSEVEKVAGVVYSVTMIPLYIGVTRLFK